jgi:hypothetical protein
MGLKHAHTFVLNELLKMTFFRSVKRHLRMTFGTIHRGWHLNLIQAYDLGIFELRALMYKLTPMESTQSLMEFSLESPLKLCPQMFHLQIFNPQVSVNPI